MRRSRTPLCALLAMSLFAVGCGGGDAECELGGGVGLVVACYDTDLRVPPFAGHVVYAAWSVVC